MVGWSVGRKGVARERKPLACTAVRDSELRASLPLSRREKATVGCDNTIVQLFTFRHSTYLMRTDCSRRCSLPISSFLVHDKMCVRERR